MKKLTYRQFLRKLRKRSANKFIKLIANEKHLENAWKGGYIKPNDIRQHALAMNNWIESHKEFISLLEFTNKQKIDLDEKITV